MGEENASPSDRWQRRFILDEQGRWLVLAGPPWRQRAFVTPSGEWRDAAGGKLLTRLAISMASVLGLGLAMRSLMLPPEWADTLVVALLGPVAMGIAGALLFHFWAARSVLRGLEPAPMPPRERLRERNLHLARSTPAWAIWSGLVMVVPLLVASLWMLALGIDLERFWPLGAESAGRIAAGFPARTFIFGGVVATLGAVVAIGALGRLLIMRSRADGRGRPGRALSAP